MNSCSTLQQIKYISYILQVGVDDQNGFVFVIFLIPHTQRSHWIAIDPIQPRYDALYLVLFIIEIDNGCTCTHHEHKILGSSA